MSTKTVAATPAPAATAPAHILIIDDATVVRLYYRQLLEAAGYTVEEAINGIEGLEKVLRTPFDLCIVDVNMPLMDGYAFLAALRRETITETMRAIIITTEAGEAGRQAALQAGADAYLVKPVAPHEFAASVAALLSRSR